jgi:RNA polymerase sigma factor (sigma-70 family)
MSPESQPPDTSSADGDETLRLLGGKDGTLGDAAAQVNPQANPQEVEQLFREHNAALLRFIAAKLGSKQEAHEIAQEAYVRLLRLDHREAVSYLRAFLFKTAGNLAMDRLRQRARRGFMLPARGKDFSVFELSPERLIEGEQAVRALRAGLAELPTKCQRAFLMHRVQGLSCQDIAKRMGLQERMVRLYVSRALEYLRARIEAEDDTQARTLGTAAEELS